MGERDDYADHNRPDHRVLLWLRRWHWPLVILLVAVNFGVVAGLYVALTPKKSVPRELHDPIEDDPAIRPLLAEADREAERQLKEMRAKEGWPDRHGMGEIHTYWRLKKQYLKDKYGIHWRTPAEMNPTIFYD